MIWIIQNGQKRLIYIVVSQLRNADGSGFVNKNKYSKIVNNDNVTEALNNQCNNSTGYLFK